MPEERLWGRFKVLHRAERFEIRLVTVNKRGQIGPQGHHHRSEHWVVVSGTAEVEIGGTVRVIHENESVFVAAGVPHRLRNPGVIPIQIVETRTGSYLGDDDEFACPEDPADT